MTRLDIEWLRFKLTWGEKYYNKNEISQVSNKTDVSIINSLCKHPKEYRRLITSEDQFCAKCEKYI